MRDMFKEMMKVIIWLFFIWFFIERILLYFLIILLFLKNIIKDFNLVFGKFRKINYYVLIFIVGLF